MVLNGSRIVLALIVLGAFFLVQRKQRRVSDTYMERFKARQAGRFGSQAPGREEEPGREFELGNRAGAAEQEGTAGAVDVEGDRTDKPVTDGATEGPGSPRPPDVRADRRST